MRKKLLLFTYNHLVAMRGTAAPLRRPAYQLDLTTVSYRGLDEDRQWDAAPWRVFYKV